VNGIDVDELNARPASTRAQLGLTDGDQVVGCVARLDPVKNHGALVDALALVRERHPKVALLLVGEGPEKARIEQRAADRNVRVVFCPGAVAWKANPYSSCDLYATSSSKEGLPLAPLEAMAFERAVVATDVPGHQDVVDETTGCWCHERTTRRWLTRSNRCSTTRNGAGGWGRRDAAAC
jgi:CDP-glycerol glycerophosphotransferase